MDSLKQKLSLEQRVSELEAQVADLQQKMALLGVPEVETAPHVADVAEPEVEPVVEFIADEPDAVAEPDSEPVVAESSTINEPETSAINEPEMEQPELHKVAAKPTGKSLESKIGKMLIPVAGSALIVFALVLFGSLIQPRLTDMMKAVLMTVGSVGITVVGMWKMKSGSRYYNLFAALAGCGSAACYITAMVSHFVLGVLPEWGLMVCVVLWIAAMTALSKYRSRIFCYICYVGILVAAYMTVQRWCATPVGLLVYIASVSALFMANVTRNYKRDAWLIIQYPLVMLFMADTYDSSALSLIIIYLTTLAVLVGQILCYGREVKGKVIFVLPTVLTLVVLSVCAIGGDFSEFLSAFLGPILGASLFDNHWAWSILLGVTLIGLCGLYVRRFNFAASSAEKLLIMIVGGCAAVVIPSLNFGTFYHNWFGMYWVPALLALAAGIHYNNQILRYLGCLYLLLYVCSEVSGLTITYSYGEEEWEHETLHCNVWVYFATLSGYGFWLWRRTSMQEKMFFILLVAWGVVMLCNASWVGGEISYLLLCAMMFALMFKALPKLPSEANQFPTQKTLVWACVLLAVAVFPTMILLSDSFALLSVPKRYSCPIIALVASMMVWTLANVRASRKQKILSYVMFAFSLLLCSDTEEWLFVWLLYLAGLALIICWTWRHYAQRDKLFIAALGLCFFYVFFAVKFLGLAEFWALCALFVVGCGLARFAYNPHTGELEPLSLHICNAAHELFMLFGTYLLWHCHDPLRVGHSIEGSESAVTVLLVVLTLLLAVTNLKRVNALMRHCPERLISIYNGIKFSWTLFVILWRFSAVSYVVSLAGIVLAIAFIVFGFRFRFKGLRLYGLVLTMVCVVKLLFFDIVFDNAFYRPISFLVAGILLFLISFIYFRLEKGTSGFVAADDTDVTQ